MRCRCELKEKIKAAALPWVPERTVYLDYNATTPVDQRVLGSFEKACRRNWGNPSSIHSAGVEAWKMLDELYDTASRWSGRPAEGFYLCSGGTEALSTLLTGSAYHNKKATFISQITEHGAVRHPLFHLQRKTPACPSGFDGKVILMGVDESGKIRLDELQTILKNHAESIIVLSPVNHETGAVQPVKEIYKMARDYGARLFLDAVQAAARLNPKVWAPYCDAFCFSGHKIYAPKGTALLWKNENIKISGLRYGGSQGNGLFPGTENIPGGAALSDALKLMMRESGEERRYLKNLTTDGLRILEQKGINFIVEGPPDSAPGICCISLKETCNMQELIMRLNASGICISRFSACAERLNGDSSVLKAMGRTGKRSSQSLRISLGRWSKRDDFFRLASALSKTG